MFYIYWAVGLLLAIVFAVLMATMYEIKSAEAAKDN